MDNSGEHTVGVVVATIMVRFVEELEVALFDRDLEFVVAVDKSVVGRLKIVMVLFVGLAVVVAVEMASAGVPVVEIVIAAAVVVVVIVDVDLCVENLRNKTYYHKDIVAVVAV